MDGDSKYSAARGAVQSISEDQKQQILAEIVGDLPDDAKVDALKRAGNSLSNNQKQEVVNSFCLEKPDGKTNNSIWLIVIGSFCAVLVGSVLVMAIGALRPGGEVNPNFLTVFTTVSAFLIGLFAQSPVKGE